MAIATDPTRLQTIDRITRPDPGDHYGQIIAWMICWPWNLVWTLTVHNPFRYIVAFVLREIRSTLDEIANGEFSQIERDLSDPVPDGAQMPAVAQNSHATVSATPPAEPPAVARSPQQSAADTTANLQTIDEAEFQAESLSQDRTDLSGMETLQETPGWETLLKSNRETRPDAPSPQWNSGTPEPYTAPEVLSFHQPDTRPRTLRVREQSESPPIDGSMDHPFETPDMD